MKLDFISAYKNTSITFYQHFTSLKRLLTDPTGLTKLERHLNQSLFGTLPA